MQGYPTRETIGNVVSDFLTHPITQVVGVVIVGGIVVGVAGWIVVKIWSKIESRKMGENAKPKPVE